MEPLQIQPTILGEPIPTFVENGETYALRKYLKPYRNNPREISGQGLNRLKRQRDELVEFKPQIILSDGTLVGGNQRYNADLANGRTMDDKVWISIIDFEKEGDVFYASKHGEVNRKKAFPTLEDAIMTYNVADNDPAGKTDGDKLSSYLPQLHLDGELIAIQIGEPIPLKKLQDNPDFLEELKKKYQLVIEVDDAATQEKMYTTLQSTGLKVTKKVI